MTVRRRSLALTALIVGVLGGPSLSAAGDIQGSYCGHIFSAGANEAGYTRFVTDKGVITGAYSFVDSVQGGVIERGSLTDCALDPDDPSMIACTWADAFGEGRFEAQFSPDGARFRGHWSPEAEPALIFPWTGERLGADVSEESCIGSDAYS